MVMSKRNFCILLAAVVCILAGGVAIVIWTINNKGNGEILSGGESEEGKLNEQVNHGSSDQTDVLTDKFTEYPGSFDSSRIAIRKTVSAKTGSEILRNAYWLMGDSVKDETNLNGIQNQARKGKIPVIVINMRPTQGIQLNNEVKNWEYYKPSSPHTTWNDYDKVLNKYLKVLQPIPALVVLEPNLLMLTGDVKNQQYRWTNKKYEEEFLKRVLRVINRLSKSWVYVDAGNAAYLRQAVGNVDQMATTLLRIPELRGFAINTMHFVNRTYNEKFARRLSCKTGLHYLVDTSRNGGPFSMQALNKIEKCLFDPPRMKTGQEPGWSWGRDTRPLAPRSKRWINQLGSSSSNPHSHPPLSSPADNTNQTPRNDENSGVESNNNRINIQNNNNNQHDSHLPPYRSTGSSNNIDSVTSSVGQLPIRSVKEAVKYLRGFRANLRQCLSKESFLTSHDANVWIKAPGEADGRLYPHGTYHSCLVSHDIGCTDNCQMFIEINSRPTGCSCKTQQDISVETDYNFDSASSLPFFTNSMND